MPMADWLRGKVARTRKGIERDPLLVACFAVLWLCALMALWIPRYLPLLDLPNHIGSVAIWHRYGNPSWAYDKFYTLNLMPLPYWGYFFPVHLLSYIFPIEVANTLYLSASALALPVGVAPLAKPLG